MKKNNLVSLSSAFIGFILCGASITWAAQTAFLPNDDAFVNQQNDQTKSKVYGTESELKIASQSADKNKRTFLKFDLNNIPDGCSIDDASLELYLIQISGGQNRSHQLLLVEDDTWTETALTWNNQPAGSIILSTADTGTNDGVTVVWSGSALKDQVTTEYAGGNKISLLIKDASENATGNKEGIYASKEHETYASPKLTVTFTCDGQEGCSHGFWKNNQDKWPEGYAPSDKLSAYFSYVPYPLDYDDLETALEYGGGKGFVGGAKILLRNAAASLLNAADPNVAFPWSKDEVKNKVSAALYEVDRDAVLELEAELDILNNLGCPR
jgi:hypothetical protein